MAQAPVLGWAGLAWRGLALAQGGEMDKPSKMARIGFFSQLSECDLSVFHQQHPSPDLEAELSFGHE